MVLTSRFTASIPTCSVQQWLFGSAYGKLPDKKAWIDADYPDTHYLTLSEARLLAKRLAVGLIDRGLQPGDRVLLFTGNSIYYPVLVLSIWMAGGVFTGANPAAVTRELAYQLKDSGSCMIIAAEETIGVALAAAQSVGMGSDQVFLFDGNTNSLSLADLPLASRDTASHWSELIASRQRGHEFQWVEPEDSRATTCAINYSSGTTGLPKGAEISHYNMVASSIGMLTLSKLRPDHAERMECGATLCFLPMYHAYGQSMFITLLPHEHVPIYVMSSFDFVKMLSHIQTFRISILYGVPPIFVLMSKHPLARAVDFSSLDTLGSGAAPLPANIKRDVDMLMPPDGARLRQAWGMTEVTCSALAWDMTQPAGSGVGELLPDCQAKLIDVKTGAEIYEPYTQGELWISSPTIMRGYWRNPRATAEAIVTDQEGRRWLRTGDVAYAETYGPGALFHIVDRFKELIKVNGFQVAPAELEALLLERDDIVEAAVVAVNNGSRELPRAFVVRAPGSMTTGQEIASWLAERVAPYKRLTGGVAFIDVVPKNPSGKILRKMLRDRANQDMTPTARL